jgi:hypothetical protein
MANPDNATTRGDIRSYSDKTLFDILRHGRVHTEQQCNELVWAKEELRRRGFTLV